MDLSEDKKVPHHDPGWNDPPLFSYDALNVSNNAKKTHALNKRVYYPMGSSPPQLSTSPPSSSVTPVLPPSGKVSVLPPSGSSCALPGNRNRTVSESSAADVLLNQETLKEVMTVFEDVLKNSWSLSEAERSEVRKRLGIMSKMWQERKLNATVCNGVRELSQEFKSGNIEKANQIHVALMVDHTAICSTWMVGIRKLFQHLKSTAPQPTAITAPVVTSPVPEEPIELVVQPR